MSEYEAIRHLTAEYTFRLDGGDFAGVGELLSDAVLRPVMAGVRGDELRGRAQIEAFYVDQVITYKRGSPMTRHLLTNQVITLNGDEATSRCYFTVLQRPPGLPYRIVVGGQYFDRFVRRAGRWRFAEKTIQVDHLNEIEFHFRIDERRART
ncbi:nuclear transport factor 2 family protein [Acrocarpospora sp. B8E8]|uniref:nuclear transport factor 2 family protein n=1 Tax=Acrocarpospora sp. B8E8 TaxID=3153572 RepID=UPI00325D9960